MKTDGSLFFKSNQGLPCIACFSKSFATSDVFVSEPVHAANALQAAHRH